MKKILMLLLISLSAIAQQTKLFTVDSTEKVYVLFVRNDSVGVVYQGKQTAFTADGVYAYNFTAFDLGLKGFIKFDGLQNSIEATKKAVSITLVEPIKTVDVPVVTIPTSSESTIAFSKARNYAKARYFVEPTDWPNVSTTKATLANMQGFDFAPIEANQGNNIYEFREWNQSYISIAGRDIWQDGNKKYFIKPKGYNTDLSTHLMDFDLRFPDFTLPKNKIVVMQATPAREYKTYNYLKKGVSYVKDKNDSQGYTFVSDGWLTDLGCPYAYDESRNAKEIFDKWCNDVDSDKLLQSFINNVYLPYKNVGYVMLNWEHVGHRWNVRKDKIIRCLEYWATHEHTAKMALWTVSGIGIGRPNFQGLNTDFSPLLTFDGTLDQFQQKYNRFVSIDFSYAKYVEIGHIGGYMNYPVEQGLVHHYLTELLLHRKYNKDKKVLWTFWIDQEPITNFNLERVKVESKEGNYFAQVKPKVFPSVAFNVGVWSLLGDGLDCWSDPNYWTDKKEFWGWGAIDENGNDLPTKHDEILAKYPSQPMKVVDWIMSGVWAMSANKDIIEHSSEWQFVTLPTKSFFNKSALIAYKIKGNEALALAYDAFGRVDGETIQPFKINDKIYEVKTFGRFTSVVRLQL